MSGWFQGSRARKWPPLTPRQAPPEITEPRPRITGRLQPGHRGAPQPPLSCSQRDCAPQGHTMDAMTACPNAEAGPALPAHPARSPHYSSGRSVTHGGKFAPKSDCGRRRTAPQDPGTAWRFHSAGSQIRRFRHQGAGRAGEVGGQGGPGKHEESPALTPVSYRTGGVPASPRGPQASSHPVTPSPAGSRQR